MRGCASRKAAIFASSRPERLGAELAERVAEVEPRFARRHPDAERPGDPFGDPQRPRRHRRGDLVGVGALGGEVGPHRAVRRVGTP